MERAIRVISLERGHDPADFTLVCFGGAGGMHAADLARNLGIPRVLVPRSAGILSALGMLLADYVRDYSRTLLVPTHEIRADTLKSAFGNLEESAVADFVAEEGDETGLTLERTLDVRYRGQGFEIAVPFGAAFVDAFHEAHAHRYGYSDSSRDTEVVNVRVRAVAKRSHVDLLRADPEGPDASAAVIADHVMLGPDGEAAAKLLDREQLRPGNEFSGPALIVEYSTTTVVPVGFTCRVDESFNLILEPGAGK
jgi:N-methylhydantoinase A